MVTLQTCRAQIYTRPRVNLYKEPRSWLRSRWTLSNAEEKCVTSTPFSNLSDQRNDYILQAIKKLASYCRSSLTCCNCFCINSITSNILLFKFKQLPNNEWRFYVYEKIVVKSKCRKRLKCRSKKSACADSLFIQDSKDPSCGESWMVRASGFIARSNNSGCPFLESHRFSRTPIFRCTLNNAALLFFSWSNPFCAIFFPIRGWKKLLAPRWSKGPNKYSNGCRY